MVHVMLFSFGAGRSRLYEENPTGDALDTDMPWVVVRVGCFLTVLWLIAKVCREHAAHIGSVSCNAVVVVARGL